MSTYAEVDFWSLLHELRTQRLRAMPPGARTVLSGGCSSTWYFHWFAQQYPSVVRHIGVEAFLPHPGVLPPGAEWHSSSLAHIPVVANGEVDLVFGGQVIEHLWPDEAAGFLSEAHRILRRDGLLVLDSPNRRLTPALAFENPGHTLEFTVDEAVKAVQLAGFEPTAVLGVWLCYDRDDHRLLPLDHHAPEPHWSPEDRIRLAAGRPEDSFVWWLEARRREQEPDRGSLVRHLAEVFHTFRPLTLNRLSAEVGVRTAAGESVRTTTRQGEEGYLLRGPRVPIRAGSYIVRFEVGSPEGPATSRDPDAIACELDVWSGESETALSRRELRVSEVPLGQLGLFALPCALEQTAFGVEFRVRSTGQMDLTVRLGAELVGLDGQMAFATSGTGGVGGAHLPSDRHWWRAPVRWLRRAGGAALGG